MRSLPGFVFPFLFAASLHASWVSVGPDGGRVSALAVDVSNPAHVIAGADNGVFETNDAAVTWRRILTGAPIAHVAIDPTDPAIVYAADQTHVFRTDDGGATWSTVVDGHQQQFKTISSVETDPEGDVYVGLACSILSFKMAPEDTYDPGVEHSADHGRTWSPTAGLHELDACIRGVTPDPAAPGVVYARTWTFTSVTYNYGWRSTDAGATLVRSADPNSPGGNLLVHPVTKRRYGTRGGGTLSEYGSNLDTAAIVVSDDAGATWRSISSTLPSIVAGIAIDPASPDIVHAATRDGLYRTTNLGVSWEKTLDRASYAVVRAGSRLYSGTASGVFLSDDGGTTWSRSVLHDAATSVHEVAADPNRPATLYAWIEDEEQPLSMARSRNAGATWEALPNGLGTFRSAVLRHEYRPKMAVDGGGNVYALLGTWLARLREGETTWELTPIDASATFIVADPDVSGTIYVAGSAPVVRRSNDGGMTWIDSLTVPGVSARGLAIDPVDPRILFAGSTAGTYRTADGGATWAVVHSAENCSTAEILSISPADHHVVWRLGCRGLERSTDDGATWKFAATGVSDIRGTVADAHDRNAAVLWTDSHGLQRTTDGGATWPAYNDGLPAIVPSMLWVAAPRLGGFLYAGTFRAGTFTRSLQPRRRAAAPR